MPPLSLIPDKLDKYWEANVPLTPPPPFPCVFISFYLLTSQGTFCKLGFEFNTLSGFTNCQYNANHSIFHVVVREDFVKFMNLHQGCQVALMIIGQVTKVWNRKMVFFSNSAIFSCTLFHDLILQTPKLPWARDICTQFTPSRRLYINRSA